ncbi:MAG: bifunctional pyr operon transcriptional regulator/uracil phosphoribosyltransferase PyrR [Syntrophobacterales bacterium]|nr:bifunctional pyr operon transcriptional regulator/uracil phosphoribosyltransferase PyrR [Syntrophobacterales bacterium]
MEKSEEMYLRIMDASEIEDVLDKMAQAILEDMVELEKCVLVGIRTRGVYLANRLKDLIKEKTGRDVSVGNLDITLYRDDWTRLHIYPVVRSTTIPGSLEHKNVVLIDDVLYTGRTVRAALDALLDYGRPNRVYLAVLIDRGHRELPICAQYVGKNVETKGEEHIDVRLKEFDGLDEVLLVRPRG